MPIEDVDYLRQNSQRQNYIFLVDSLDRDHIAYPNPSEYVVEFTTPFHNVIGLEVLDASIPRTMYNVDVRNNSITFLIHTVGESNLAFSPDAFVTAYVEPGDYTLQTLVPALNEVLSMRLNNDSLQPLISITASAVSNPPEVKSILQFKCPYAFAFDMSRSTIAETLGFDLFTQISENQASDASRRYACYPRGANHRVVALASDLNELVERSKEPGISLATKDELLKQITALQAAMEQIERENARLFHSVDLPPPFFGAEHTVFDGPRGVVRNAQVGQGNKVAQQFEVKAQSYLTKIFAALTTNDQTITNSSKVEYELYTDNNGVPGTLIPLTNVNGQVIPGYIPISFTDGGLSDQEETTSVFLDEGKYWLVFTSTESNTRIYYNDVPVSLAAGMLKTKSAEGEWTSMDTPDGVHFEASIRIIMQDEYHKIVAPGIYSLVGERYIVLRCPEIEENSYRSLAYSKHCLGLAKFRLGVVGFSENRVDFSKVPTREFHPIGKLSRMTLRFETSKGELYDFKGVNHSITFAIHYYEPIQKQNFKQSILNPNYNGNMMEYMYYQEEQEEDSDDQEYDYNRDPIEDYRIQESRHLPENVRRRDLDALYHFDDFEERS